jgi:methyl-accepting chemotaxis protein
VRRGAASTSRAIAEQSAAGEQVSREAVRFRGMSASVSTAMAEQATAVGQIAHATQAIRRQSDQTSRGLAEQSRAASDIQQATRNVARQIGLMVNANREQSENARAALETLAELRRLEQHATKAVQDAGLSGLLSERARATDVAGRDVPGMR